MVVSPAERRAEAPDCSVFTTAEILGRRTRKASLLVARAKGHNTISRVVNFCSVNTNTSEGIMKAMKLLAVGVAVCLLVSSAVADDKKNDNAKLAVGTWEIVSTHEGGPPKGGTVEFTKDGKIKVSGEENGMKMTFEGTYKIDGNKMVLTFKFGDNDMSVDVTIDKLDETTFASSSAQG